MRRARRQQVEDLSARTDIAGPDPTSLIADKIVVRRALDQLQPDDRIVLALRFHRDMKIDDIAAAMVIKPRAASSRLYRAVGGRSHDIMPWFEGKGLALAAE